MLTEHLGGETKQGAAAAAQVTPSDALSANSHANNAHYYSTRRASPGVDCRPANDSLSTGNIRRIFGGIFETPCAEWYTNVDSRRLST
eukprot:6476853-Pyramimonas_sp.AAC.1